MFGPLHTLQDPIVFAHTNFGENILIGGDDMPPEQIRKTLRGGGILFSGLRLMLSLVQGPMFVSSCIISAKSDNLQPSYGIQIIQDGRHPQFWIMEQSVYRDLPADGLIFLLCFFSFICQMTT